MRERTIYERQAPDARLVTASLATSAPAVFWLQDAPAQAYPTLRGSQSADLTVVGGGYAGLWTAVLAKRRNPGQRVILLEAGTIGWAASGRNGGFCEASLTHGYENGLARWPDELAELERLGEENLEELAHDLLDLQIDAEFERTGFLAVAVEEHQVPWLSDPPEAEVFDGPQIRAEIASPIFLGAAWDRHHTALVHPAKLARGLARAAADLGVEVFERSRVLSLDSARSGPVTLQTAQGSVTSGQVALATNVFRPLLRRARHFTVPVYDYVLMTEPLSPAQLATVGWHHRQGFGDLAGQFHYSRLTADNRILYGGYDAIYHPGGGLTRPTRSVPRATSDWRRTSSRPSRNSRTSASRTVGPAPSTRAPSSVPSMAWLGAAGSRTPPGSPGSVWERRGLPRRSCSTASRGWTRLGPGRRWSDVCRCPSLPNRWPASASNSPAVRSTPPIIAKAVATCSCAPWTRPASGSTPERHGHDAVPPGTGVDPGAPRGAGSGGEGRSDRLARHRG